MANSPVENTPLSVTVRRRRAELGMTLKQIADHMGVSEGTAQRWESGTIRTLRYGKLVKLAQLLQVSPLELTGNLTDDSPLPATRELKILQVAEAMYKAACEYDLTVGEGQRAAEIAKSMMADRTPLC